MVDIHESLLESKRFIVTGGCGFIGGHLVDRILSITGTSVTVIDSCRYGDYIPRDAGKRFNLIQHQLGPGSVKLLCSVIRPEDVVFHLAAEKLHQSSDDFVNLDNTNIHGTASLLEAAAIYGCRVIMASSLYAHGRMSGPAMREDDVPEPTTRYGQTKLCGERLLLAWSRKTGLPGAALRFFFVYGPRQHNENGYKSIIVKNFERLAKGLCPTVCGNGLQALDYIYIDDIVRALLLSTEADVNGDVVNIGSGRVINILDLVGKMQKAAGTNFRVQFIEKDFTDGSSRQADTTKAIQKLGFRASIGLEKGLASTWEWSRSAEG